MKLFIAIALLVAAAAAAPAGGSTGEADAVVLKNDLENIGVDGYNFESETSNGLQRQEKAILKNVGTENEALDVVGFYSYPGPNGVVYRVDYTANENGFRPIGAHLPVAQ